MTHPLAATVGKGRWFASLAIGTLLLSVIFLILGPADPSILAYEFAATEARSAEIIAAWSEGERLRVAFGLGFDYLYLIVYSTMFAFGCLWVAEREGGRSIRSLAPWFAWAAWGAATFDMVENLALFNNLLGATSQLAAGSAALVAALCATGKFLLLAACLLFIIVGLLTATKSKPIIRNTPAGG